jgi:hypothetical protein
MELGRSHKSIVELTRHRISTQAIVKFDRTQLSHHTTPHHTTPRLPAEKSDFQLENPNSQFSPPLSNVKLRIFVLRPWHP